MSVRSLNKVLLIGNLTRDPNLRFTPNNTAVCSFGIATNRTWTPTDGGEKQEKTEFHNIVAWGKLAEICEHLLHKGDKIYVEGRLQTRDWKTNEGAERRITEVIIEDMMLLHSKGGYAAQDNNSMDNGEEGEMAVPTQNKKAVQETATDEAMPATESTDAEDIADDIPF